MGLHGRRLFALAWLGVYPIVTLVSWFFGDALLTMPLPIRTLVLSGLMVGYMIFFWIPFIQRFLPARERGGSNVSIEPWPGVHPGSASSQQRQTALQQEEISHEGNSERNTHHHGLS